VIRILSGLIVILLILSACGSESEEPLPTLADMDALATGTAIARVTASAVQSTPVPPTTAAPTATLAPPTATLTLAPSATPPPTDIPPEQLEATGIALTNTALANVMPFTQTADAIRAATQTVQAGLPPATETPPPTEPPPPTQPLPDEPFQVVYYTDRNGNDDIYLMTLNGVERAITRGPANEREPSCSPDGRGMVYASDVTGRFQIYFQRLDSTDAVQLTDSEGMNFAPVFSPDGSTIAFVSTRQEGVPIIWLMDADGGNPRPITTELGRDTSPSWSPDGRQILFSNETTGPWDMYITVLDAEVPGEFPVLPPELAEGNELWPFFDPLGERIAYTVWDDLNDPQTTDIYLLDFEQPAPVPLRAEPGADIAWAWGDETHLLISNGGPDDVQIALLDVTTGEVVRLTNTGPFNGGARLCTVDPAILPLEPTAAPATPTPTPTLSPSFTPTQLDTETPTPQPSPTPTLTVTPSPTAQPETSQNILPPALATAQGRHYTVQQGDTLLRIASAHDVTWQEIYTLNNLTDPNRLKIGQQLLLPVTRKGRFISGYQHPDLDIRDAMRIKKLIVVKLKSQHMYAYENGRLVRSVTVSTGLPGSPTVTGEYAIYQKLPAQTMSGPGYYLPGVPWVMYFYQGYGLHGTYWHNNFGTPMSHGCVNLPTGEAKWLYDWAEVGTPVIVMES
jgi:LysM repeat protein